ncbi:MAG: hypothetical protein LQ352_000096 [Teloschistes flavicans]|nr:MAG: hypothetical protein LQ352_000096 [Teloschistes flavicans]
MASNVFSRFLPASVGSPSIYETLRQQDESSDQSDVEERAALAMDEENSGERFQDYDHDHPGPDIAASQIDAQTKLSTAMAGPTSTGNPLQRSIPLPSSSVPDADEPDDEVPQSLLIEDNENPVSPLKELQPPSIPSPLPGPVNGATRAKWRATQEQQQLYSITTSSRRRSTHFSPTLPGLAVADPRERAMWRWANVEDLDNFLRDVYDYFLGNGIWCILLSRLLNLL